MKNARQYDPYRISAAITRNFSHLFPVSVVRYFIAEISLFEEIVISVLSLFVSRC